MLALLTEAFFQLTDVSCVAGTQAVTCHPPFSDAGHAR